MQDEICNTAITPELICADQCPPVHCQSHLDENQGQKSPEEQEGVQLTIDGVFFIDSVKIRLDNKGTCLMSHCLTWY